MLFATQEDIRDDSWLRKLRDKAIKPKVLEYEYVIFDEQQDMTGILYWLTCTFLSSLRSLPNPPRILLLGDPRQAIYGYQGADARYLERGEILYSDYSPYPWQRRDLPFSRRLSPANANLVNIYVGEKYVEGINQDGGLPIYIHYDKKHTELLLDKIHKKIEFYGPGNCAILAPTVRKKS